MKVCSDCQRCYDDSVVSCSESEHAELEEIRSGGPQMVAGYHLETLLGSGIKGETYRARRLDSGQPCLIKIVSANDEYKQKFLQDSQTATTLFNQSIVDIYESGSLENSDVFVVAEEPAGQTVRELLNNVGVPQLLTSIQVMRQAAEAVHALHLGGLIHRAIRPENIVLTNDAEQRLLVRIQNPDLGGVVEHSIVSNKFLIDSALDSLRYFAPEQFSGGTTIKTDVYGLGIVLYEMLSGAPPFDADKASGLIDMHRNQRPPDVTIDNFDLRMLLIHTLMESLQKAPEKRQSSANAFARQLRHMEQLAMHSPTPPPASVAPTVQPPPNFAVGPASTAVHATAVAAKAEIKPAVVKANDAPRAKVETVPVVIAESERRPLSVVSDEIYDAPIPRPDLQTMVAPPVPKPVSEPPVVIATMTDAVPPRSRLKRCKKQLRAFAAHSVADEVEVPPSSHEVNVEEHKPTGAQQAVASEQVGCEQSTDDTELQDPESVEETESLDLQPFEKAPQIPVVPVVLMASASAAASPAPRKIEWEQPDDDIPTLDEIPEALFAEPMPATKAAEPLEVPSAASSPRKIEWVQPEDDIPLIEDDQLEKPVLEVSSTNTAPEETISTPSITIPRKIEWEQPEDDIPSIADVQQVLSTEPEILPSIEPLPPALPISSPRKIEWVQPEDDMPSMDDVLDVLSKKPVVGVAVAPAAIEESAPVASANIPRKIEWEQPEDDIPSMEDVFQVLSDESIEAAPVSLPTEEVKVAPQTYEPRKIEWIQPEDDIPSMNDVLEVLSAGSAMEAGAEPPAVEENEPTLSSNTPKKIDWTQPDDDIPSPEDAMEVFGDEEPDAVIESEPVTVPVPDPQVEPTANANLLSVMAPLSSKVLILDQPDRAEPELPVTTTHIIPAVEPKPLMVQSVSVTSVVDPEPEEITLVSPPRRITIDWEKPAPWEPTAARLSNEIEFFPTLLGDVDKRRTLDSSKHFFSDYDDAPSRASDHHRSLMIGSGFIALIALFLYGNDSFRTFFQAETPSESASVQTSTTKQTLTQPEHRTTSGMQPLLKGLEKPKPNADLELGRTALKVSTTSSEGTPDRPAVTTGKREKEPQTVTSGQKSGKSPLVPSTLVISSDDGKISARVETQKRSGDRRSRSGQGGTSESTRPRIVETPRQ
jgi:serine/threonine protein kinase